MSRLTSSTLFGNPNEGPFARGIQQHISIRPHSSAGWSAESVEQYPHSIKTIESFQIRPRWLFVRIETVGGVVGWGEGTLEGHTEAVQGSITEITRRLVGWDAMNIEEVSPMRNTQTRCIAEPVRYGRISIDTASTAEGR